MASTRNKNTPGDYKLEQRNNIEINAYNTTTEYGVPQQTNFAGNGLLPGRVASLQLSNNSCDIESQLFGIGSTNLVVPKQFIEPSIKQLPSLNMMDRLPILVPEPLVVERNQRPYLN